MRRLALIAFAALMLASSCGTARKGVVVGQDNKSRDSVRVEVRTEYRERIDTAYIEIPTIIERRVVRDTCSRIENEYAVSTAAILPDGFLSHSLATKPAKRPVPVISTELKRDTTYSSDKVVIQKETVEVQRPLTRWQRSQIIGFWALLSLVVFATIIRIILKFK